MEGLGLILSIAATVCAVVGLVVYYVMAWYKKHHNSPENIDPPKPQEAPEPAAPAPPQPIAPSVKIVSEYLGNSNTKEIHDLRNIKPTCQIDRMNKENKVLFKNIEEAKKAMESMGYNGCRWCLNQYNTD